MASKRLRALLFGWMLGACAGGAKHRWPLTSGSGMSDPEGGSTGQLLSGYCPQYQSPGSFGPDALLYNGNTSIADLQITYNGVFDNYAFTLWVQADVSMHSAPDTAALFQYTASGAYVTNVLARIVAGGKLEVSIADSSQILGTVTSASPVPADETVLVIACVVKDPTKLTLRVGSQTQVTTSLPTYSPIVVPGTWRIGGPQLSSAGPYCFSGTVSCAAFSDKALGKGLDSTYYNCPSTSTGSLSCQSTPTNRPCLPVPPYEPPVQLHLWPLDDVARGNDVTMTSSSLTSPQTQACFRTAAPTVLPGSSQTRTFLHFDGSSGSALAMAVNSSAVNGPVSRAAVWARLQGPGEGVVWSYLAAAPPVGGGVVGAEAALLAGGVLEVRLWESSSQTNPCGTVSASVSAHYGVFVLLIVERDQSSVSLRVGDGAVITAPHTCLVHTGDQGSTPGVLTVGDGYRGDLACLTFTSGDLDPLDSSGLLDDCLGHSFVDTSGAVCDDAISLRWERFSLLAADSAPTLAALGSSPARSLVSCARRCVTTPLCRSFTFGPVCRLYDLVTVLAVAPDTDTRYYRING